MSGAFPRQTRGGATDARAQVMGGLILLLATSALVLGWAGCRSTPEPVIPQPPQFAPRRDLEYTKTVLKDNARPWATLGAKCDLRIINPRIPGPTFRVTILNGRLSFAKPDKVRLVVPDVGPPDIRLIGDGKAFSVEMPLFQCAYYGRYEEPVALDPRRLVFLPADVADALEPTNLLAGRGQTLTQGEQYSDLYSLEFVEFVTKPERAIRIASWIRVSRTDDRLIFLEKYNQDGSIRARVLYGALEAVMSREQKAVQVPTRFDLVYPEDQTRICIELRNVVLDSELSPELFRVEPAHMGTAAPPRGMGPSL